MDAVVLAGGKVPPELAAACPTGERALIELEGVSLLDRVLESLRAAPEVERIIVVTTPKALAQLPAGVEGVPSGDTLSGNLLAGAGVAKTPQVLLVTGDIPLVTGHTWSQFLNAVQDRNLDAAYPIVKRETCEIQFPGGKRTYARLRDGTFTGGNAFVLQRARLDQLRDLIETAYSARKNPLKLAVKLGPGFILRVAFKRLTVAYVEAKLSQLLGCRGGAIICDDAAIGFDVDKAADLVVAAHVLQARTAA